MPTTPISSIVSGYGNTTGTSSTSSTSSTTDFQSDFMQLLMAQLKNQNPMDPVDDKDLLTQMAQLNSLTELQNISDKLDKSTNASLFSSASNLIGKTVTASTDETNYVTGVVTSIQCLNNEYTVSIGDQSFALDKIYQVSQTVTDTSTGQ
jgi:flagellar basal-body rod modification protein FlgD